MAAISLRPAFYPLSPEKTMYRLVAVAAALMALACSDQNRNSARNAMANAADSAGGMAQAAGSTATGMMDSARSRTTAMAESAKSTMGNMADSSNATATTASAASDTGNKTTSSAGALAPSNAKTPAKLTRDQLKQLQTALNNDGCSVGTPDGVMGAKTKKAVACSMTKHNIQNDDYSALYQALNLSF